MQDDVLAFLTEIRRGTDAADPAQHGQEHQHACERAEQIHKQRGQRRQQIGAERPAHPFRQRRPCRTQYDRRHNGQREQCFHPHIGARRPQRDLIDPVPVPPGRLCAEVGEQLLCPDIVRGKFRCLAGSQQFFGARIERFSCIAEPEIRRPQPAAGDHRHFRLLLKMLAHIEKQRFHGKTHADHVRPLHSCRLHKCGQCIRDIVHARPIE